MDGIEHINVYSKGKTELGRLLSNFAHTPFSSNDLTHHFESVEGWWYWYITGKKHNNLKSLYGFKAKEEGKKHERVVPTVTPSVLFKVYVRKIECNKSLHHKLIESTLPFTHYYMYGDKVVATEYEWSCSYRV